MNKIVKLRRYRSKLNFFRYFRDDINVLERLDEFILSMIPSVIYLIFKKSNKQTRKKFK